ncbi:hypothetical protein OV208_22530 [Corallococcus sp. bb12-1]|uniref:hypothetical protein n=1 Tax=Corallococcus sp. bb12-1 TaxID=2996784 RepID=UPI0022721220|nr:hypothetical protein [Corallococcus sp. bb12-1]MCY1044111.1 hypothetical protein [Corallococcus sp. bb12-1]
MNASTRASLPRWFATALLGSLCAVLAEGLVSTFLGRFAPSIILLQDSMHGGEQVGDVAGAAVILGLCFAGARRAWRHDAASLFWASIALTEVLRWIAGPVVLGLLLLHFRGRGVLPDSLGVFVGSAFFWWPLLLLASLVSAFVQVRRFPAPRALRLACAVVGATTAVLLMLAVFFRPVPTLYYLQVLWALPGPP